MADHRNWLNGLPGTYEDDAPDNTLAIEQWRCNVAQGKTILGYADWIASLREGTHTSHYADWVAKVTGLLND